MAVKVGCPLVVLQKKTAELPAVISLVSATRDSRSPVTERILARQLC